MSHNKNDALPISKQQLSGRQPTHTLKLLLLSMRLLCSKEYPFGYLGSAVTAVTLPTSGPLPGWSLQGGRGRNRRSLDSANMVQQQLKQWWVTNIAIVRNPKHRNKQPGVKKVISQTDRSSTTEEINFSLIYLPSSPILSLTLQITCVWKRVKYNPGINSQWVYCKCWISLRFL